MKHILGMLKPYTNLQNASSPKIELDYLRLIYAVSEIRKRGHDAQGYYILTDADMLDRLNQFENDYHGNEYVKVLKVSLESYLRHSTPNEKTEALSAIVKTAISDTGSTASAAAIRRRMRDFILAETILGLEPGVRQVKAENQLPFRVRWDYYGVIGDERSEQPSKNTANHIAVVR